MNVMNGQSEKMISVCIPRMDSNTTQEYILQTLSKINMGQIVRIIELPIQKDPGSKRLIIKLRRYDVDICPNYIFERLRAGENIKIVHNFPWYWKMVITHPQKPNVKVL